MTLCVSNFTPYFSAISAAREVADQCTFSLEELAYEYPEEIYPDGMAPQEYLEIETWAGAERRYPAKEYPGGVPDSVTDTAHIAFTQYANDPDVQADMLDFFRQLVVEDTNLYRHSYEGPDDQPAHIRGALTSSDLKVPMQDGRLMLGRYQGIFLFEHRTSPKTRHIALHLLGS